MAEQAKHAPLAEALMRAYVDGWHDAHAGKMTDAGKIPCAAKLLATIPEYVASPELLDIAMALVEMGNTGILHQPGGRADVARDSLVKKARAAIAKAEPKQ